ncbi:MAG: hypothetical protein QW767_06870 [Thermoprotei archaeon]
MYPTILEDSYIQKIDSFFINLENMLRFARELTGHLTQVLDIETRRLAYETSVVEAITGLLEAVEPEAELKAEEIEHRRLRLTEATRDLGSSLKKMEPNPNAPPAIMD